MRRIDVPVLIVGAGPAGLTAAILLARQGVASLMVDRRGGPHRAPQAHVVNPRSLEILRSMDVDMAALHAAATPRADGGQVVWATALAGVELGRMPYERQDDAVLALTPEPLRNLPQHRLEPILVERLAHEPHATLRWRHEWQALAEDADGVTSRVRDLATGEDVEVRSRWVIAADGAGSRVRKAIGIEMVGPDQLQSFVMIHVEANLRALVRDRPAILYWIVDPARAGTFVAHDIERSWVVMHRWNPSVEPAETFTPARCADIVRRAIGRDDVELVVRDVGTWTMTAQLAERFRAGRVFLVGDSAHRFPPAGGLGLNTGVQDAHNLAWKLAWVEDRRADVALLETYELERRPVAQRNAEQSFVNAMKMLEAAVALGLDDTDVEAASARLAASLATAAGRAELHGIVEAQRDHFDMLGMQLGFSYDDGAVVPDGSAPPAPANPVSDFVPTGRPGARLPHAWVGECRSVLDLLATDRCTLIVGHAGAAWVDAADPSAIRTLVVGRDFVDVDGAWARAAGIGPDGALLVRPDQHVAWRAASAVDDPRAAVTVALRRVSGR